MKKRVLVIGNGAREHIIAETLKRSEKYEVEIFVVGKAKNPGLVELCEEYFLADVCDKEAIVEFAAGKELDFAIVGPEAPIAAGVVDALEAAGVNCASPLATVGRLESSKGFARDLLAKYDIPGNPQYKVFSSDEGLEEFFAELGEDFVVKADGLKGGKGVKVSGDHLHGIEEGVAFAKECLADGGQVVIEEKFVGQEFSLMSFCDGSTTAEMPAIQDHKRAYDGDKGPNTGGMGSYSYANDALPFLKSSDIEEAAEITRKVALALKEECGVEFRGVMYGGFIAVKEGVRLIEYNARFGDPEVMNALCLLKTDFVDVCEAIVEGRLADVALEFEEKATVCKYVVPEGYPDKPVKGEKIEVGEVPEGVKVYYAAVDDREDGLYLSGSRAVAFVGVAEGIEDAEKLAASAVGAVKGPVFYRKDIGTAELINKRVEMMRGLRD
jgi:phosphoribosylamine---glycine ligase